MKLTEMLNMSKSHMIRVLLCSIATMGILLTVNTLNRVFMYIFVRWNLDISSLETNVPMEVVLVVVVWNYVIGFTIAGLLWKYVGLPKTTVIGKFYKRYMDSLYEDDQLETYFPKSICEVVMEKTKN